MSSLLARTANVALVPPRICRICRMCRPLSFISLNKISAFNLCILLRVLHVSHAFLLSVPRERVLNVRSQLNSAADSDDVLFLRNERRKMAGKKEEKKDEDERFEFLYKYLVLSRKIKADKWIKMITNEELKVRSHFPRRKFNL